MYCVPQALNSAVNEAIKCVVVPLAYLQLIGLSALSS